ncbi:MAG: hypothetical protein H7831_13765, partial [Magnetococcus sp. WYHC-3]
MTFNKITKHRALFPDPPHTLGGSEHTTDTISNLNAKISDASLLTCTKAELHLFADGTNGNDANTGLIHSKGAGAGGTFTFAAGVVVYALPGAAVTTAVVGQEIFINNSTSNGNDGGFIITAANPALGTVTYTNADGVTEATNALSNWFIGSPKKGLSAVELLIPDYCKHNVVVHISGTFVGPDCSADIQCTCDPGIRILIDGGTKLTTVVGPFAADIHTASSIGFAAAGWVADAYRGCLVEILSGPCLGETRGVQIHNATTITPHADFSGDPG